VSEPRVLVVEDEMIVANQIKRKLKKIGYAVVATVRTGEKAVEIAAKENPDIALMDIKLAGKMDGVEAADELRIRLGIPVIYLTAHADETTLQRAKITGPLGYIVKPFEEVDLKSNIAISLYRSKVDKKLKESEDRYRKLFNGIPIPLFRMTEDGQVLDANTALVNALKFADRECFDEVRIPAMFLDPGDKDRYETLMGESGVIRDFETQLQCKDGSTIWVSINSRLMIGGEGVGKDVGDGKSDGEGVTVFHEGSLEDITQRKNAEEEMKRKLMKFKLEEGNLYLVKEATPSLSIEAMKDLLTIGYSGTVLSRAGEADWKVRLNEEFTYFWLAQSGGKRTIKPDLSRLKSLVSGLSRRNVLIIDRFDYLIFTSDFTSSLEFLHYLREQAVLRQFIVILSLDPLTVKKQELRLIELECREIESQHQSILSDDHLSLLRFVYKQNAIGLKPSYSNIAKDLRISRPTVRKRLIFLISTGYVIEHSKGNSKVLELTHRGRELFWK